MRIGRLRAKGWLIPIVAAGIGALAAGVAGCGYWAGPLPLGLDNNVRVASSAASHEWAEPMNVAGLPNLHMVSDGLYRGAEPTTEGIRRLDGLGIKTIIDLRSPDASDDVHGTDITYVHIPATAWMPEDRDVVEFLHIVMDESRQPIFVHCQRGADRTGMMTAIYRVAVQGWSKDEAIAEMTHGGFGFYSGWQNLVRYVRDLNIDQMKQQAQQP